MHFIEMRQDSAKSPIDSSTHFIFPSGRRRFGSTRCVLIQGRASPLALSTPECTHIQDELRIVAEKKAEKEEEKQKMEKERAALKKTETVSEEEERERLWEKNERCRAEEIEEMTEDFREKHSASTKERPRPPHQHRMTMARIIKKKVAKKIKKKGLPHWLGEKSVLGQMEEHVPLDVITAFRIKA